MYAGNSRDTKTSRKSFGTLANDKPRSVMHERGDSFSSGHERTEMDALGL